METLTYIFALILMLIGGALILKTLLGQSGGVMALLGFLLLMGGITTFNKVSQKEEDVGELTSSIEHQVVNNDLYQQDAEREVNGYNSNVNREYEEGEGIDFSGVNAKYEQTRLENEQKRLEMQREKQRQYEINRPSVGEYGFEEE